MIHESKIDKLEFITIKKMEMQATDQEKTFAKYLIQDLFSKYAKNS